MANVLTVNARLVCSHQGAVTLIASQQQLTVDGSPVLVIGDLDGALITGCALAGAGGPYCQAVKAALSGAASTLRVGGKPALLDTATGTTTAGTWSVLAPGQTTLTAN